MKYDTHHIEKYLNGKLSQAEVKAFEQEMKKNRDFAHEVKLQEVAVETVQYANFMNKIGNIREKIAEEKEDKHQKSPPETPVVQLKPKRSMVRRLITFGLSAAAVLLIIPIWSLLTSISNPELADNNHTNYPLSTITMSNGEQTLQQTQTAYNSGDYAAALPIFEKYPDKVEVQLAKGNAEYNLGKFDAAAATFKRIISSNKYPYHTSTANWYLALTYLKQDKGEAAKAALQAIKSGEYYDKAQQLLKEIK